MKLDMRKLVLAAAFPVAVAFASPAMADFTVCNRSDTRVDVAVGYNNAQRGWMSVGWYVINPGRCHRALTGTVADDDVYVYAQGNDGRRWSARRGQTGGWFCIAQRRFSMTLDRVQRNNVINCRRAGMQDRQFIRVNTRGNDNFRFNLDD